QWRSLTRPSPHTSTALVRLRLAHRRCVAQSRARSQWVGPEQQGAAQAPSRELSKLHCAQDSEFLLPLCSLSTLDLLPSKHLVRLSPGGDVGRGGLLDPVSASYPLAHRFA